MRSPRALLVTLLPTTLALAVTLLAPVAAHAEASAVSGVVTDRTGAPVAGTLVWTYSYATRAEHETTTDDEGRYVVGADAGSVAVCFQPPEDADLNHECWDDALARLRATILHVADGTTTTGIDPVLDPATHLRGTLTDSNGRPAAGVGLGTYYRDPTEEEGLVVWSISPEAYTDAQGRFDLRVPAYGEFRICFSDTVQARYLGACWRDGAWFAVTQGESVEGIDLPLADRARISGRVSTRDGGPTTGMRIELKGTRFSAPVGRDGRWSILGPQHGTYRMLLRVPRGRYTSQVREVTVATDGVDVTGIDSLVRVAPPLRAARPRVQGRLTYGRTVRVVAAPWDGPATHQSVRWFADGRPVSGERNSYLRLRSWMVGRRLTVVVRATTDRAERSPGVTTSAPTARIAR